MISDNYNLLIINNEEEADVDDPVEEDILHQRELILLVKENPPLYAKTSKEYCGKGFNKDIAWKNVGASLTMPLSGTEASKLFYSLRQRFGRERRKVLVSLKGKSGQGTIAPYISTWPLYNDCMFLADHIVARKTSSSYSVTLPKKEWTICSDKTAPISAKPSPSSSPPVFRSRPLSQTSSNVSSRDNDLFLNDSLEYDFNDNQSSAMQSPAAAADEASSSSMSSVSQSVVKIPVMNKVGSIRKRTVPQLDKFAIKKKKEDDTLTQAIVNQTTVLSSVAAKLGESLINSDKTSSNSVATSNNANAINPIMSAISFALQSVPIERHLECMMELLSILTQKYCKN